MLSLISASVVLVLPDTDGSVVYDHVFVLPLPGVAAPAGRPRARASLRAMRRVLREAILARALQQACALRCAQCGAPTRALVTAEKLVRGRHVALTGVDAHLRVAARLACGPTCEDGARAACRALVDRADY